MAYTARHMWRTPKAKALGITLTAAPGLLWSLSITTAKAALSLRLDCATQYREPRGTIGTATRPKADKTTTIRRKHRIMKTAIPVLILTILLTTNGLCDTNSMTAADHLLEGAEKLSNGDYNGAIKAYNKAIALDPKYALCLHPIGDLRRVELKTIPRRHRRLQQSNSTQPKGLPVPT